MKSATVLLGLCVLATGCTSAPSTGGDRPEATAPDFSAPKKVRPPKLKPNLAEGHINRCVNVDKIDINSLAGRYTGPIDFTSDQVRQTREIDFATPTDIDLVDESTFRELLSGGEPASREERAIDLWLQWQLGVRPLGSDGSAVPPGNPRELVAGYYEHDSGHIVVEQEGELDDEYVVLAHELGHAAVDQVFGISDKESLHLVDDETLATTARIEGDATLLELRFLGRFSGPEPVKKYVKDLVTGRSLREERDDGAPHAVMERFSFPYRWGLAFACSVFERGGWPAVDRMHRRPPTTTAEIMFPERYLKKQRSKEPRPLGSPPKSWKLRAEGSIGAADLKSLFEAPADSVYLALSRPLARAAAWDGGAYKLWGRGLKSSESILGISLVEHRDHPGLLCSSLLTWYRTAFHFAEEELIADGTVSFSDPTRTTVVSCLGRHIRMAMAPNTELARAVHGSS